MSNIEKRTSVNEVELLGVGLVDLVKSLEVPNKELNPRMLARFRPDDTLPEEVALRRLGERLIPLHVPYG